MRTGRRRCGLVDVLSEMTRVYSCTVRDRPATAQDFGHTSKKWRAEWSDLSGVILDKYNKKGMATDEGERDEMKEVDDLANEVVGVLVLSTIGDGGDS